MPVLIFVFRCCTWAIAVRHDANAASEPAIDTTKTWSRCEYKDKNHKILLELKKEYIERHSLSKRRLLIVILTNLVKFKFSIKWIHDLAKHVKGWSTSYKRTVEYTIAFPCEMHSKNVIVLNTNNGHNSKALGHRKNYSGINIYRKDLFEYICLLTWSNCFVKTAIMNKMLSGSTLKCFNWFSDNNNHYKLKNI